MKKNRKRITTLIVILWLIGVACCIADVFWKNELVYNLPTPIPKNYKVVSQGTPLNLGDKMNLSKEKPTLLHFFNPKCPCSRFNIKYFKSLAKKYGSKMNFAIVVITNDTLETSSTINERFDLDLPICFDKSIAEKCGVISTPQAVIIDKEGKLFYRGNYNKSRYCTDVKSDYARMAIDTILANQKKTSFNPKAYVAYGCSLPNDANCKLTDR